MRHTRAILRHTITALALLIWLTTLALWATSSSTLKILYERRGATPSEAYQLLLESGTLDFQYHTHLKPVTLSTDGSELARPLWLGEWGGLGIHLAEHDTVKTRWNPMAQTYRQVGGAYGRTRELAISLWWPFLISSTILLLPSRRYLNEWRQARRRRAAVLRNRCSQCGYDLRATPDRCPECGTATTSAAT